MPSDASHAHIAVQFNFKSSFLTTGVEWKAQPELGWWCAQNYKLHIFRNNKIYKHIWEYANHKNLLQKISSCTLCQYDGGPKIKWSINYSGAGHNRTLNITSPKSVQRQGDRMGDRGIGFRFSTRTRHAASCPQCRGGLWGPLGFRSNRCEASVSYNEATGAKSLPLSSIWSWN
jgi:hypothetical protein